MDDALTGHPRKILRVLMGLIDTPERLEIHVSHTKQKIGTLSNRYRSHNMKFCEVAATNASSNGIGRSVAAFSVAAFLPRQRGLQLRGGAPRISAFMEFAGKSGIVSKPSGERWAFVFMGTDGWLPGLGFLSPGEPKKVPAKTKMPARGRRYITALLRRPRAKPAGSKND